MRPQSIMLIGILKRALAGANLKIYRPSLAPRGMNLEWDLKRIFKSRHPVDIFDVGAHVGQTATRFVEWFPGANIHSFEPVPETYESLVQNTRKYPRVHCHKFALGERDGDTVMKAAPFSGMNGRIESMVSPDDRLYKTVPIVRLDTFCDQQGIKHINLLKTDCEGYDLEALIGGESMFSNRGIDVVYCEVNLYRNAATSDFFKIEEYLRRFGFVFFAFYEYSGFDFLTCFTNALFVRNDLWASPSRVQAVKESAINS